MSVVITNKLVIGSEHEAVVQFYVQASPEIDLENVRDKAIINISNLAATAATAMGSSDRIKISVTAEPGEAVDGGDRLVVKFTCETKAFDQTLCHSFADKAQQYLQDCGAALGAGV
ncbi:hypothetical protein GC177_10620 [bacterium]|nr:hypothetical protein [bacterium]